MCQFFYPVKTTKLQCKEGSQYNSVQGSTSGLMLTCVQPLRGVEVLHARYADGF